MGHPPRTRPPNPSPPTSPPHTGCLPTVGLLRRFLRPATTSRNSPGFSWNPTLPPHPLQRNSDATITTATTTSTTTSTTTTTPRDGSWIDPPTPRGSLDDKSVASKESSEDEDEDEETENAGGNRVGERKPRGKVWVLQDIVRRLSPGPTRFRQRESPNPDPRDNSKGKHSTNLRPEPLDNHTTFIPPRPACDRNHHHHLHVHFVDDVPPRPRTLPISPHAIKPLICASLPSSPRPKDKEPCVLPQEPEPQPNPEPVAKEGKSELVEEKDQGKSEPVEEKDQGKSEPVEEKDQGEEEPREEEKGEDRGVPMLPEWDWETHSVRGRFLVREYMYF